MPKIDVHYYQFYLKKKYEKNKAQKSRDNSVLGVVFSHAMPKMDFRIPNFLVEKKHTKLICHMPWLYQYPPRPFHRPYTNYSKILKKSYLLEKIAQNDRSHAMDISRITKVIMKNP